MLWVIVYLARDIRPFVMYCVNGKPRSSLLIESTDSMIGIKNEQRSRDTAAQKRANKSGVGKSNNHYEDIYYTSLQHLQHPLITPILSKTTPIYSTL